MGRLLVSSLTLALATGGASAQAASAPPLPGAPPAATAAPPRAGPEAAADDEGGPPPPPPGGRRGPASPDHRPPPPPTRAAHFRLERGDMVVEVKCADDEPMQACGDLTLELIDRLRSADPAPSLPPAPKP